MKKNACVGIMVGLFAASAALAQPLPPGPPGEPRCRTTTTVECTGTAATAAVPYGQDAQPPAPVYAPPPAQLPPPVVAPMPSPYGAAPYPYVNGNPPLFVPMAEGFRLAVDEEGRPVMERRRKLGNKGLWATGLTMFLATPVISAFSAGLDSGSYDRSTAAGLAFLPIIGSWVNAGIEANSGSDYCDYSYSGSCSSHNHSARAAGWAIGGIVQASGFVMFLVGLGTGPEKVERFPLRFGMSPTQGGAAMSMNGHF